VNVLVTHVVASTWVGAIIAPLPIFAIRLVVDFNRDSTIRGVKSSGAPRASRRAFARRTTSGSGSCRDGTRKILTTQSAAGGVNAIALCVRLEYHPSWQWATEVIVIKSHQVQLFAHSGHARWQGAAHFVLAQIQVLQA
jgi:hypothetical protein